MNTKIIIKRTTFDVNDLYKEKLKELSEKYKRIGWFEGGFVRERECMILRWFVFLIVVFIISLVILHFYILPPKIAIPRLHHHYHHNGFNNQKLESPGLKPIDDFFLSKLDSEKNSFSENIVINNSMINDDITPKKGLFWRFIEFIVIVGTVMMIIIIVVGIGAVIIVISSVSGDHIFRCKIKRKKSAREWTCNRV